MDPEAAAVVTPHLLAGEELLWCGRPHDTAALRWRAAAIVIIGAAALALRALPLDPSLAQRADADSIVLAALFFVMIAGAITLHSYLSNTFYGVTNQRALIVAGLRELEVTPVFLEKLNTGLLKLRRFGNTLVLARTPVNRYGPLLGNPSVVHRGNDPKECYRLLGLENAGEVYRIILDAADKL
jgi:hypothetical protein